MFTIPNTADAAFAGQADPDKVDLDILVAALQGSGVAFGCDVTAQAVPDMTVAVAAGVATYLGATVAAAAGNVAISAAHATNPRIDLIVVRSAGVKSAVAGTAAASPAMPSIPAASVVLAAVWVPATDAAINTNQIVDKRAPVARFGRVLAATSYNPASGTTVGTTSATFSDVDSANLAVTFVVPTSGKVLIRQTARSISGDATSHSWNVREGAADVAATEGVVSRQSGGGTAGGRRSHSVLITGLTPGDTKTYKWGHARANGTGSAQVEYGQTSTGTGVPGAAVMEVIAVP